MLIYNEYLYDIIIIYKNQNILQIWHTGNVIITQTTQYTYDETDINLQKGTKKLN